jgi:hypothetical protein
MTAFFHCTFTAEYLLYKETIRGKLQRNMNTMKQLKVNNPILHSLLRIK